MSKTFSVNIQRYDPYKNFRFLVYFGTSTRAVAGVSKVSGLKRTTDVIEYKEGGSTTIFKGLGRTKYEPITLERGVTHDSAFEEWANASQAIKQGEPLLASMRRTLSIELNNEAGQPVHRYIVHDCWVSEYQALSDLDAGGNSVVIEHIKLEHHGWEHDLTLPEPKEKK